MELLLIVILIIALALVFSRPGPRSQTIYVPVEITETPNNLGCLPIALIVVLTLLALGIIRL